MLNNLFAPLSKPMKDETVNSIVEQSAVRIERIVSFGHTSPKDGWYDQNEHEWVAVLQGEGHLEFEDGQIEKMKAGDHIMIPAHRKHKVIWTKPNQPTIWLAVFYAIK